MLTKDDYLICPKCKQSNTVDFWDKNTKAEQGIEDGKPFVSSGVDSATHDEVQSYFNCPTCNEEVDGIHLKRSTQD
jgi:Zn ribbon nucleic-acid-binding protein